MTTFADAEAGSSVRTKINAAISVADQIAITATKILTVTATLTLAGTDGSTLNIGTGGTLGTAAYAAIGTSGDALGKLNAANTWAGQQTFVAPVLGAATATSINKVAITAPASSATLTIADGKTLTASNTITFTATDGSTLAIGTGGTLATAAFVATGTSGTTIPLLDGTNTWSGQQTYARGTITTSQPHTLTQTWNAAGVTFEGALLSYTSTASATLSRALSIKLGGTEKAGFVKDGSLFADLGVWKSAATSFNGANYHGISFNTSNFDFFPAAAAVGWRFNGTTFSVISRAAAQYAWSSTGDAAGTIDTGLQRSAAATVKITDGTTGIGTIITKLPTADPGISGAMWNNAGTVAFSA